MPTLKLHVEGMRDPEDARRAEGLLTGEPGVFAAIADPAACCIEVDLEEDETGYERLLSLLSEGGFRARLAG